MPLVGCCLGTMSASVLRCVFITLSTMQHRAYQSYLFLLTTPETGGHFPEVDKAQKSTSIVLNPREDNIAIQIPIRMLSFKLIESLCMAQLE